MCEKIKVEKQTAAAMSIRAAAQKLADYNLEAAPETEAIYLFPSSDEIRLIETDPTTLSSTEIVPYYFGAVPESGILFRSSVALIRPEEAHRIGKQPSSEFIQQIRRRPELQRLVPGGPGQVSGYVKNLLPCAELIENLAPANISNGPNPEYPWQTPQGVVAPVDYPFCDLRFNLRGMVNMLKFLDRCFQIISES